MHVPQVFSLGYETDKKKEIKRENKKGVGERALYKSVTRGMQSALHYIKKLAKLTTQHPRSPTSNMSNEDKYVYSFHPSS